MACLVPLTDNLLGSSDANEAVSIELVQAGEHGPRTIQRFHPKFTYPIFGDEQRIFGYKDLGITFRLSAHDLRPNFIISYEKRYPPVGETRALDVGAVLEDFVPECESARPVCSAHADFI